MEILIVDTKTISEVQREFNTEFPYLKIEFFDVPYKPETALPKSKIIAHDKKLSACRRMHSQGSLIVKETDKVSDLEKILWDQFGLSAQVFRKSGNLWIETSLTDSWTLSRQNKEGREMSQAHNGSVYKQAEEDDLTDRDKWE
jgi:hypothetical protein